MDFSALKSVSYHTLLDLATEEGLNASGRNEIFNCFFGRDNAISVLKILHSLERKHDDRLLAICRQSISTLINLQGQETNVDSGEEPGKFIHEYRNKTPNFDSIDSTPLSLIAMRRMLKYTEKDLVLPAVLKGLNWLINYGDRDHEYLLEYSHPPERSRGSLSLSVQSWTDSVESLRQKDGQMPKYPIAPVEVQGYAWLALRLWADEFPQGMEFANNLKRAFNEKFLFIDNGCTFLAQALDGDKNQIQTVTGNPLLLLWASYRDENGPESILDAKYIADLVKRSFLPDLFDKDAGIRTMSTLSPTFNPGQNSYHNGSFWPVLNGMAHEGLEIWGYTQEAKFLRRAGLKALDYFKTPIELYVKDPEGKYQEYRNETGQTSCRQQAWSAAVALDFLAT